MSLSAKSSSETLEDNVYLNLQISNPSQKGVPLTFFQALGGNIVPNPRDYYLSCIRWTLNGGSCPLFTMRPDSLFISIRYNGIISSHPLIYGFPTPLYPYPDGAVYSYQRLAEMINEALALCAADCAVPGAVPYMLWDPQAHIYSFYTSPTYLDTALPRAEIWINTALWLFFENFRVDFIPGQSPLDFRIYIQDLFGSNSAPLNPTIPANTYKISQEYANPGAVQKAVARITFVSNTLGVRNELTTAPNNTATSLINTTQNSGIPSSPIFTDFVPTTNASDPAGYRQFLVYLPVGQYRLTDILTNRSDSIDMTVQYFDTNGNSYPFILLPGQGATFKLLFVKRTLYRNPEEVSIRGERNRAPLN